MRSTALSATLLLALVGCSGDGDDSTDSATTNATTTETTTDGTDTSAGAACYDDREAMKPAPSMSIQETWGAPCMTDGDCVTLLGDGAVCDFTAVIYELPGGFCTKPCVVGDDPNNTTMSFELDDPECDPAGGIACVGANGIYSRCAPPCTDDSQCTREGYFCRTMPQISAETDPTFCLMDDCCEGSCAAE